MAGKAQSESNIQTFLRVRPSKSPSGYFKQDDLEKGSLTFALPNNYKDYVNNSKLNHSFHFNDIIDAKATQDDVFKKVGMAAVQNALEGFNSTIFAYGQTGSGKTFTLTGGPERYSDRGIIPRAISTMFNEFRTRTDVQFKSYISYLELYNEQGYDLLDPSHETKALEDLPKVSILEDEHGNFHLKNLSMHPAESEEDALNLLFLGDTNRAIAETPMNMASSRSHCIFTISVEARVVGSDKVRRSKLHLVDLAGSERVAKTNSSGSVLSEAKYINTSLFFLEMVIVALYEKANKGRTHVPYRNSMMTSVLRDSLGGNCKTIMIATINPEASHTEESLSTCKFAQRVSLIKNRALLNEEADPSVVISRLKSELLNLREEISFLKGEAGEGDALSPMELEDIKTKCRQYCFDRDPRSSLNIGPLTLTKIKDVFAIMKNLVLECQATAAASGVGSNSLATPNAKLAVTEDTGAMTKQVKDLKSLLLQRDSEINILVNMVKKGKTADDVGIAAQRTSSNSSRGTAGTGMGMGMGMGDDNISVHSDQQSSQQRGGGGGRSSSKTAAALSGSTGSPNEKRITAAGAAAAMGLSYQQQQAAVAAQREKDTRERIIQRHLFGVPPPDDRAVFDDAAASFAWFSEKCSLNTSLVENKDLLRDKIAEAKTMGERANHSRNTINYLKNSIEAIRKERVLSKLSHMDSKEGEGAAGEDEPEDEESEEETTYRRAIDQEKVVYKESFDRLRVLKPEIEHIRKMVEKCRGTMQSQFDQWYQNLHARNGNIGPTAHSSGYLGGTSSTGNSNDTSMLTSNSLNTSMQSTVVPTIAAAVGQDGSRLSAHNSSSSRAYGDLSHQQQQLNQAHVAPGKQQQQQQRVPALNLDAKRGDDSKLTAGSSNLGGGNGGHSGSGATGNTGSMMSSSSPSLLLSAESKVDDSDVNEDILAFYQAKEELLKRRGAAR
mmetsp:Transcript_22980/g.38346  ORF Transcript_22980/g.38346 Transcript_22980/m.38346 type:complete len:951 (+) Transcript_22980:72-2924(+)